MGMKIGQIIDDKYEIVRLIGEGGMGAVYEGRNRFISRTVAIKVLLPAAIDADPTAVRRFEREAQAAGRIGSDHILEVLDLGSLPGGERYLVMEYLDGETLAARIHRLGRMSPRELLPILIQALHGLTAAHRAGIVHRDLKPDNLFILREKAGTQDFVKLIDFGISKFSDGPGSELSMTRTGALMGTPYYMSPEQAKGAENVNHQTDLYSLGVIAFEAVTGRVPYDGNTFNDLMFKIVLSEMPNPEELVGGLDPAFSAIVRRAMDRDLGRRFGSAEDFLAALERWSPMALTVADGTPMSVQGAGLTGDFGVQTLGQGDGLLGTRIRTALLEPAEKTSEELSASKADLALPSSGNVSSEATLAATSIAHETAIPSTHTKAPPQARPPKNPAADGQPPAAGAATAPKEPGTTLFPETADPAARPRPGPAKKATDAAPDRRSQTLVSPVPLGPKPGRRPKGTGRPGDTLPEGPPTEPLPLRRSGRRAWRAALLAGAALAVGIFFVFLESAPEDENSSLVEPETAALQKAAAEAEKPAGAAEIAPIELPHDSSFPDPLGETSLTEDDGKPEPEMAPPEPAPSAPTTTSPTAARSSRPAAAPRKTQVAPKPRPTNTPPPASAPAVLPTPAPSPPVRAAATFPDPSSDDSGPRDFGY